MTRYGAGDYAASEHVFRRVLAQLEQPGPSQSSTENQIFLAAARLNLANSLRQQYLVRACVRACKHVLVRAYVCGVVRV